MLRGLYLHIDDLRQTQGPTGHAVIQIDQTGQNCILISGGTNDRIDQEYIDQTLSHFEAEDYLVLQNEISCLDYAIFAAHKRGMTIFLNPSPVERPEDIQNLELVDYHLLNEIEGKILSGLDDVECMAETLCQKYGARIILTLGEKGVRYCDEQKNVTCPAYRVDAVDTTAAGDTFTGYFIASLRCGVSVEWALKFATAASALCVSQMGAANSIPYRQKVDEWLSQHGNSSC